MTGVSVFVVVGEGLVGKVVLVGRGVVASVKDMFAVMFAVICLQ